MKKIWITVILGAALAVGIFLSNVALAGSDDDNDDDEGTGLRTITYTITKADKTNDVVIGPISGKMFVMIFKTSGVNDPKIYDGFAKFEAQREDGTWAQIGPIPIAGLTTVGGMDSFGADDFKLPLTVRVEVTNKANMGTALAQLDFLNSAGEDDDDDEDDD